MEYKNTFPASEPTSLCPLHSSAGAWWVEKQSVFIDRSYETHKYTNSAEKGPSWGTVSHPVKKFPEFNGTRRSLPHSQQPLPSPVPIWRQIKPACPFLISWRYILISSSHLRLGLPNDPFPRVSLPKSCMHIYCAPYLLHVSPIVLIWSLE